MRIKYVGAIVFAVLILIGIAIFLPVYLQEQTRPTVMLSFSIINSKNIPQWCNDLSSIQQKHNIKATIFIAGKLAEIYPKCVSLFSSNNNIDLGSSAYDYSDLASISDYTRALKEVKSGKMVIDRIGKLDSKVFRAPYGSTDENIYSLLTNSGILADFSYANQYNKYENGQFIKYDLIAYNASNYSSTDLFDSLSSNKKPVMIDFDNSISVSKIDTFIAKIKSMVGDVDFVNASDLTNMPLTIRKDV